MTLEVEAVPCEPERNGPTPELDEGPSTHSKKSQVLSLPQAQNWRPLFTVSFTTVRWTAGTPQAQDGSAANDDEGFLLVVLLSIADGGFGTDAGGGIGSSTAFQSVSNIQH